MLEWKLAEKHFQEFLKLHPNDPTTKSELEAVNQRLKEATGDIDVSQLYIKSEIQGGRFHDTAQYIGPVKVVDIPNKGKGTIATKEIAPGTLLMVSKAFSISHPNEREKILVFSHNGDGNNIVYSGIWYKNVVKTVEKLWKNPQRTNELYQVYADEMPRDMDFENGIIDIKRIMKICRNW